MMRNTLPPLLQQIVAPLLQLRCYGLNSADLLDVHNLGPRCDVIAESGFRQFDDEVCGIVVDVFAVLFQHLDGGSDLSGRRCVHNQMWMLREGVWPNRWRWFCRR